MQTLTSIRPLFKQQGIALIVLLVIIVLASISFTVSQLSVTELVVKRDEDTRKVLIKAKQALINYAVLHSDGAGSGDLGEFGYLPCTHDSDPTEGEQDTTCGGKNINDIGYYPWDTLGTGPLRDDSGSCLLYAISGSYKNNINSGLINEDTNGLFQIVDVAGAVVTGANAEDRIVAIIIAPGKVIEGQSRSFDKTTNCGDDYSSPPSAYLEGNGITENDSLDGGADGVDKFLHASFSSRDDYNDLFITISRDEIWSDILNRSDFSAKMKALTEQLAYCLVNYAALNTKGRMPWPAPTDLLDYRNETNYADASIYAGRYPFDIASSNAAITVGASNELFTQGACDVVGGLSVDLTTTPPPASEYRALWNNWKDHFLYIVSKDYAPASTAVSSCGSDCITVNSDPMAGVVIYSGSRQGGQVRNDGVTGEIETKNNIANYIEITSNSTAFTAGTGSGSYVSEADGFMFCIKPDLTVIEC